VLAWDDNHDRSHLVAVDTLERERRYARFQLKPSLLDASGDTLLRVMDLGAPATLERLTLKAEPQGSRPLPFPEEAPVPLSAEWNAPPWSRPRCAGRAGLVATIGADGRALLVDFRDFEAPRVVASARLWVPPTWDVRLTPFEDALGIVAHDVVHGTATVWRVSGRDVFDAETDEPSEVSRLLPDDSRELRRFFLARVRLANEAAHSTGTRFELKALELTPKHYRYAVSLSAHGGRWSGGGRPPCPSPSWPRRCPASTPRTRAKRTGCSPRSRGWPRCTSRRERGRSSRPWR